MNWYIIATIDAVVLGIALFAIMRWVAKQKAKK